MQCLSRINARACESFTRPALISVDANGDVCSFTWPQLQAEVVATVSEIDRQGFHVGDRLVHAEGNSARGVVIALASLIAGTIEVPLDPSLSHPQFDDFCQRVQGRWWSNKQSAEYRVDAPESRVASFQRREQAFSSDQPALILFTSGSSGQPKGVVLSRKNLFTNAQAKLTAVHQTEVDVRLTILPLWHAYARTCDLMTWLLSGCTLAIDHGWNGWQRLAPLVFPTLINTVPSFAARLMVTEIDSPAASKLRLLGCGGAAMTTELFEQFGRRRITVIQGYGLTETSPVVCSASPWNARPGFVGTPVSGCSTRISHEGVLEVAGDGVMIGYWNDPVATQARIRDGWLSTGDCVEVDPQDGQFKILGRVDDRMTLSNGRKIFPGPIEAKAMTIPAVRHALVVPEDRHVALIIDHDAQHAEPNDLLAQLDEVMQNLPEWQRPRRIQLLEKPFSEFAGAITQKGTLCRPMALRFAAEQLKTEN
jgi:long-chain acyl-CoA synthetase